MQILQETTNNRLLAGLSSYDFLTLQPLLVSTDLPLRKVLENRGRKIEHVYFPESGVASMTATAGHHTIEIGIIGREGMTGASLIQGVDTSAFDTFMQGPGNGWRLAASDFLETLENSATLRAFLGLYSHVLFVQTAYTALSDGRYKLDERLARWLLMALDRVDGDVVTITHEFLSLMLGVRRPGVTNAIAMLGSRKIIQAKRGSITVLNRDGLREAANGSYGAPEAEFDRYLVRSKIHP